jgi:hypothetical protein
VAKAAGYAQVAFDHVHRRNQLIGRQLFQHLDIFELLFRGLHVWLAWLLCRGNDPASENKSESRNRRVRKTKRFAHGKFLS